jgi:protein translocase SecG subunit
MGFITGLLTFILVIDCLFLIFLVLMQLPKKEAGIGTAFGGGATDALFGPGSGNVLTKATKYSAGIFLVLALILSVLGAQRATSKNQNIRQKLDQNAGVAPALPMPGTPNTQIAPAAVPPATNVLKVTATNAAPAVTPPAPAPAATNKPAAAAPAPAPAAAAPAPAATPAAPAPVKK